MKATRLPGFVSYAAIALWFLLTLMRPLSAHAEETALTATASDLAPTIEAALMRHGVAADAVITLDAPATSVALVANGAPIFDSVSVNPITGRFLIRARSHPGVAPASISGRAAATTRFPVLTRSIARGDIIAESDIVYVERNDLPALSFVTNAGDVIGKVAMRPLRANTPLRANAVKAPQLVKKGALVTVRYKMSGLQVSHHGVARQSGALGDVINIMNTKSERTIKAVITGTNEARVIGARQQPSFLDL
ncbi:MAG: flagellar basal body P-ring formation chaperone FlgA [Pseudomonadota bacterium]